MSTPFFRFFDKFSEFSEVNLRAKHFSRKLTKKLAPQVCAVGLRGGQYLRAVGFAVDRTPGTAQVPSATTLTVTPGLSVSPHSR